MSVKRKPEHESGSDLQRAQELWAAYLQPTEGSQKTGELNVHCQSHLQGLLQKGILKIKEANQGQNSTPNTSIDVQMLIKSYLDATNGVTLAQIQPCLPDTGATTELDKKFSELSLGSTASKFQKVTSPSTQYDANIVELASETSAVKKTDSRDDKEEDVLAETEPGQGRKQQDLEMAQKVLEYISAGKINLAPGISRILHKFPAVLPKMSLQERQRHNKQPVECAVLN